MKIKIWFITLSIAILFSCTSNKKEGILKSPSEYFPEERAKILVVGTFHFAYPDLDAVKSNEDDRIDVLKEPKKSEVTELVNYIKKFKPNKIAIEATESWNATEKLARYKQGEFKNNRDERYQIGMRLASELNLDTLYGIDVNALADDLEKIDSSYTATLFKDFDFKSDDPYNKMVFDWIEAENKVIPKVNLLNYLKHTNSREYHQYDYGVYLVGDFKLPNARGADILSVWWYNRNLRIFRKLQEITGGSEDRILLIFGNGHAAILRSLIEASPEYEFIEFDDISNN
ncbi:MAG: hypothetical protein CVU00_11420 [Bacteroidetes bacterium HGW-Bacteroidetes-17]|jgi:hypothetical protein|nr:MAG: hypothetical protein CVU00_11420 [Bacteroidetes bacterium HGW-Bacteroidetes-17]